MAVIATRTPAVSRRPYLATDRGRACLNFLCFCLMLGHPNAHTFLVWKHAPRLVVRPCLPDQGALRCIVSGTGAVPTVNVTLLSTRERSCLRIYSRTWGYRRFLRAIRVS